MNLKSKLFAGAVGVAMVLSSVAIPASAQTTAELTAQINSLLAMIAQLQAQLAAQGGSTTTGGAGMMFTQDLTLGSTGSEVTSLQQWLVSKGYLMMPAGTSYGYFGPLTQSALAKYQAEAGISPAAGYFGPITRAKVNAMGGSMTGGTTGGTTTGGTTGGATGITTPGMEGTLTVTSNNAGLASTAYEGDSMIGVLGFNVEAKTSDIAVQRIKLQLGDDSTLLWRKGYSRLYVTADGNTLTSVDLNSSTVVKEGSDYFVTITGFNYVVPKDSKKQIVIKADVMSSIDSTDRTNLGSESLSLVLNGVRGIDGAGIDQYSPSSAISRTVSFSAELSESATLKLSLNSSSPKKVDVVASSGADEDELDKLTTLIFDVRAEKDDVTITDMRVGVVKSGSGAAIAQTAYLFDGSSELDSASVSGGMASFTDIDYVVPKDTTKSLTVKIDVRDANATVANFVTQASTTVSADLTSENSQGDSVAESGSAIGYSMGVRSVGPEVTLVSKSVTTQGVAQTNGSPVSTSTLTATFHIKVKAMGGDVMFGTAASGTPMFASSTTSFKVYKNGAYDGTVSSAATSTSYTTPPGVTTSDLTNSFTLSEGNEVTIPVTFQIIGRNAAGTALTSALYSVGFEGLQYVANGSAGTINFMTGEADWRTADVSFP